MKHTHKRLKISMYIFPFKGNKQVFKNPMPEILHRLRVGNTET